MARIFITGSSDGLGALAAKRLISRGHTVVIHARNPQRAKDASAAVPGAAAVLVADLTSQSETVGMAAEADAKYGPFDAVVHNAGLYTGWEQKPGKDGLPSLFCTNVLAPYLLTASMKRPKRLVFVSSGLHRGGSPRLEREGEVLGAGYSDSKLHDVMLANAFARRWEGTASNSLDPGWVPTKMGGAGATDDIEKAVETYVMLALGEGEAEGKTGSYWHDSREQTPKKDALDEGLQDRLLAELERISGVKVVDE